jgi:hypothetical protein
MRTGSAQPKIPVLLILKEILLIPPDKGIAENNLNRPFADPETPVCKMYLLNAALFFALI